jgi:hypothetical protein
MYRNERNCERICPRCLPFAAYRRRATRAVHAVSGVSEFILKRHMREGYFKNCSTARVIFNPLSPVQRKAATGRTVYVGYIGTFAIRSAVAAGIFSAWLCDDTGARRQWGSDS